MSGDLVEIAFHSSISVIMHKDIFTVNTNFVNINT